MLIEELLKVAIYLVVVSVKFGEAESQDTKRTMSKQVAVDFEVYGRVQGVFFRKYTQKRAVELGLKGWCMNTDNDTVVGRLEGDKNKIDEMKHWLQKVGSPQSAIDKAEFRNETEISVPSFADFRIKK